MARLLVHVEGETEELFVREVLRPHLFEFGYSRVDARLIGNARQRDNRGGIRDWPVVAKDIVRHLRQDGGVLTTTMVDYYALPNSWPGREQATHIASTEKADAVKAGILAEISAEIGEFDARRRFLPFVMMYEFEGILFSDCNKFAEGIGRPDLAGPLSTIRAAFPSPEEINDSPVTAPSKRIRALCSKYEKPLYGSLAALSVGLDAIMQQCPQFNSWVSRLQSWPAEQIQ